MYFSANSTRRYIDVLDELVEQYNNTKHSSIGMTPKEVSKKENETKVWRNLYGNYDPADRRTPKFSIGDNVRITRKKEPEKLYTPRWTEEVFSFRRTVHRSDYL